MTSSRLRKSTRLQTCSLLSLLIVWTTQEGRKETNHTYDWAQFSIAICNTENVKVKLTWSGVRVECWSRCMDTQRFPAFLEEAGSASGFGFELRLSKRVVRTQSWGWLGIRQKHWAEEDLASGRVQGWDYTVCEKSRNEQWAWEGQQVNKVRTVQQFCHQSLPRYFYWRVLLSKILTNVLQLKRGKRFAKDVETCLNKPLGRKGN